MTRFATHSNERASMIRISGVVGILGLVFMAASFFQAVKAQVPSTAIEILDEKSRDNRKNIQDIRSDYNQLERRFMKIESELDTIKNQNESLSTVGTGLFVGIGVILFERAMVFIGWMAKLKRQDDL